MVRAVDQESDLPLFRAASRKFLSVSELNELIKGTLESQLDGLWVQGEISNFRVPPSGHCYFTLKDDKSQICAVMFRRQGSSLRFVPENGMAVLCFGRVSLYSVRGDLQLYVEDMEPQGQGALYLAFEQLKKKLAAEGLFAEQRKRALPVVPLSIGIVTSAKGAALYDMLRIIGDRFPDRRIAIRPVKVQGDGAGAEIAQAVADLNRFSELDVMIVGRGGGSLEDLWAFNEEVVADRRAPTPTAAAEMVVPRKDDLLEQVNLLEEQLLRNIHKKLEMSKEVYRGLVKRLADPGRKLRENQQHLDELSVDLLRRFQARLRQCKDCLAEVAGRLGALSPLAVLERGYSITHKLGDGRIVKDAASLAIGDLVRITFALGKSLCRVERKE
jgi:exodeoxyribonuclease VII large subunit